MEGFYSAYFEIIREKTPIFYSNLNFQPDEEKPQVLKKQNYTVFRHKPTKRPTVSDLPAPDYSDSSSSSESDEPEKPNFLKSFIKSAKEARRKVQLELKPVKSKRKKTRTKSG